MAGRDVTRQGKSGRRGQSRASQGVEGRAGKSEGNAKDNAGHSALQEKAKGAADCAQSGGQGRADYKY